MDFVCYSVCLVCLYFPFWAIFCLFSTFCIPFNSFFPFYLFLSWICFDGDVKSFRCYVSVCISFILRAELQLLFQWFFSCVSCFRIQGTEAEIALQIIHDNQWKKTKDQLFMALNKTIPELSHTHTHALNWILTMAYGWCKVETIKWIFQQL